jgi:hypothetical protein
MYKTADTVLLNSGHTVYFANTLFFFADTVGVARGAMFWIAATVFRFADTVFISEKRLVKMPRRLITAAPPLLDYGRTLLGFDFLDPKMVTSEAKADPAWRG